MTGLLPGRRHRAIPGGGRQHELGVLEVLAGPADLGGGDRAELGLQVVVVQLEVLGAEME